MNLTEIGLTPPHSRRSLLVLGASGMLGRAVVSAAEAGGWAVTGLSRDQFDITDPVSSGRLVAEEFGQPDWVINCAAYTAVDQAETEPDLAYDVNALGPSLLARACALSRAKLVHFSTDYVFDGGTNTPYRETDATNPQTVYGKTKLAGEQGVLDACPEAYVLRTSWLYAPWGKNFARTILGRLNAGQPLRVVGDQMGCPTYVPHLAAQVVRLIETTPAPGVYHAGGREAMSWYAFASMIREVFRFNGEIEEVTSGEFPTPAPRPKYSALDSSKLSDLIGPMPLINSALRELKSAYTN